MTDEEAVDEAFRLYQLHQDRDEILGAARMVRELAPKRIVDLGLFRGGTMFVWHNAAPACRYLGVDTPGTPDKVLADMRSWLRPGEDCAMLLEDTRVPPTAEKAARFLGGPIDFLFIDADHYYDSVSRDFAVWSAHVRPGGLIGFHDIKDEGVPHLEVWRLWAEIKASGWECREFFGPPDHQYGLGMCRKP